uniref:Uncharacterized protein n=1 Tax=viral metagenome TaxID=1070528 RepID=A0A6C0AWQ4_9ZZZZ|tara:strand:- start:2166 stop:3128 length:963 start_codon:yes stop_codon:yes gene_type:complete
MSKKRPHSVDEEEIKGAVDEVSNLFSNLKLNGNLQENKIENLETKLGGLEEAFGDLIIEASGNDKNMVSIADGVKNNPRKRAKPERYSSKGGRKQTGGDGCTPFRKNLIKLIIIAGLLGSASLGAGRMSAIFLRFYEKAIGLLSDDMKSSFSALSKAAINYIGVYIRATIDSLRISIQTNNRSIWEAFLSSLNWTNFGKVAAGIATIRTAVIPAVSNTCVVANDALDSIVDGICNELEEKLRTKTAELGTQTEFLSDAEKTDAEVQANNKITHYFTRSCAKGGRKSRRRSIKKNRKTRRKTSSKKTNKKKRRSKRKTSRR